MRRGAGDLVSKEKMRRFTLKLRGPCDQDGFAHDCLVSGTRETVGFTFFRIEDVDHAKREVQGQISALVWMPRERAQELHRQLGEALRNLESSGDGEVVCVEHMPKQGLDGRSARLC
jgi:hypothetical protein